jgi:GNAT superfamily N-acetyltransferase
VERVAGETASDAATPPIGPLVDADRAAAARVLAAAFRDNPLNTAAIRTRDPQRRLRCNLHGSLALLPSAQRHGLVLVAHGGGGLAGVQVAHGGGAVAGVLVAVPPYAYPLPPPPPLQRLRALLAQGLGVARRWAEVFQALDAVHPSQPHWYLGTLGVDPARQGRGVGRALLASWLSRVDAEQLPAYLETDREGNVAFYARAGFHVVGETSVLGVRVWPMWRPARDADAADGQAR